MARSAGALTLRRIEHQHDQIRLPDRGPGARDADFLHRIVGLAQAGGVDHVRRDALQVDALADRIARRARESR